MTMSRLERFRELVASRLRAHAPTQSRRLRAPVPAVGGMLIALAVLTFVAPNTFAAGPNLSGPVTASAGVGPSGASSAQWLALKNSYRILSGVKRNQPKGTVAHMTILASPLKVDALPSSTIHGSTTLTPYALTCPPGQTPPCSDELSTSNPVPNTFEPGNGCTSNYGSGTSHTDDANKGYCSDNNFFDLCGPGAADNALWYWPAPPNLLDVYGVVDPKTGTSTTWYGYDKDGPPRMRGYMTYLAWQMKASGWTQPGLMEQYAPGGVRLQEEEVAMNWEEDGHTSNYGFYVVDWHYDPTKNPYGGTAANFHGQVSSDIYYSGVPVVAEVNARLLPNWPSGGQTLHFITVIGYNDLVRNSDGSYGQYYYTDTCASSTACGSFHDGGVNTASYNQMWNAIMGAPYSPSTGDGGWIW